VEEVASLLVPLGMFDRFDMVRCVVSFSRGGEVRRSREGCENNSWFRVKFVWNGER
jgi:hypothetical protein